MFSVIRRYNITAGSARKIVQKIKEGFIPLLSRERGFVSWQLIDPGDGTLVTVSVFETKEGAENSSRLASEWVRTNIAPMVKTAPIIITGELMAHAPNSTGVPTPTPAATVGR
jgi:hypothetical protein